MSETSQSTKVYLSKVPCKRGHLDFRYKNNGGCVVCARARAIRQAKETPNIVAAYKKKYAANNRQVMNARIKNWKNRNKDRTTLYLANRRAKKKQAQPSWVGIKDLLQVYKQAKRLTQLIGINYHVDHIVPLQHPDVCGLHVPWNLQILPDWQNLSKQNSFRHD